MKYLIALLFSVFSFPALSHPYALVGPVFQGSSSGVNLGVGYLWKKNWAAEASYVDVGRLSGVKLGGYYRTSHKRLQGFAGANLWALDAENTRSVGTTTPATKHKPAVTTYRDVRSTDSDTALGLALGVIYHVPPKQSFGLKGVHLRAGYDLVQNKDAWGDKLGLLSVVLMKEF